MAGQTLKEIGLTEEPLPTNHVAVKVWNGLKSVERGLKNLNPQRLN